MQIIFKKFIRKSLILELIFLSEKLPLALLHFERIIKSLVAHQNYKTVHVFQKLKKYN